MKTLLDILTTARDICAALGAIAGVMALCLVLS
jgi:hypothetical protein